MRLDLITLFPELFAPFTQHGVARRAFAGGAIDLQLWPLRDHASNTYRRVDDRPYGGGPGMVMLVEPLERALAVVRAARAAAGAQAAPVLLMSPAGARLTQARVRALADAEQGAIIVCGRYEGIDQRFIDRQVDEELSLGDFVVSGGELPALVLIDAVARLLPGVLGDQESHLQDSFAAADGLLDHPHYSRPERLETPPHADVPAVLLGGHHAEIAAWRRAAALRLTAARRPDLIEAARHLGELSPEDERTLSEQAGSRSRPPVR